MDACTSQPWNICSSQTDGVFSVYHHSICARFSLHCIDVDPALYGPFAHLRIQRSRARPTARFGSGMCVRLCPCRDRQVDVHAVMHLCLFGSSITEGCALIPELMNAWRTLSAAKPGEDLFQTIAELPVRRGLESFSSSSLTTCDCRQVEVERQPSLYFHSSFTCPVLKYDSAKTDLIVLMMSN